MKIRTGFVSNSSSSSFICDICGHDEGGWDLCLSDAGFVECKNGHVFCEDHLDSKYINGGITNEGVKKIVLESNPSDDEKKFVNSAEFLELDLNKYDNKETNALCDKYHICLDDWRCYLPDALCPICSFDEIIDSDCVNYLYKKFDTNVDEVRTEIRSKFKNYNEFQNYNK